jgi:hypothetical protein
MPEYLYQLTLSSSQARIISKALDFWSRCEAGQLSELQYLKKDFNVDYKAIDAKIAELKKLLFPNLGTYESTFNKPQLQEAFNLKKVLEHAYSWKEHPLTYDEIPTVNYDGPVSDWWTDKPAYVLCYEDDEAVRVRDNVNKQITLTSRFENIVGTADIEEAAKLIKKWKNAYESNK